MRRRLAVVWAILATWWFGATPAFALTPAADVVLLANSCGGATLLADFAKNSGQGLYCVQGRRYASFLSIPNATDARNSAETCEWADGHLTYAASNIPCVTDKGIASWEQRTNLQIQSQLATGWTSSNGTLTPNALTAPDSSATMASFLEATTATVQHPVNAPSILKTTSSLAYAASVYVTGLGGRGYAEVQLTSASGGAFVFVNLTTGAITAGPGTFGTNWSGASAPAPQAAGPGVWRVFLDATNVTDTAITLKVMPSINGTTDSYTGSTSAGIGVWGADIEQATFPTPYIPTTTSAATRLADVIGLTMPASSVGTWVAAFSTVNPSQPFRRIVSGPTGGNSVSPLLFSSQANGKVSVYDASELVVGSAVSNGTGTAAMKYSGSAVRISVGGGAVFSAVGGADFSTQTTVYFGGNNGANSNDMLDGVISRVRFFPNVAPDAQLQSYSAGNF